MNRSCQARGHGRVSRQVPPFEKATRDVRTEGSPVRLLGFFPLVFMADLVILNTTPSG